MPNSETFSCEPIAGFVRAYLMKSEVSIDPFARNVRWATYTNDLNPETAADYHLDVYDFLVMLRDQGVRGDLVLFDPPYSFAQVKEVYDGVVGRSMDRHEQTRLGRWTRERNVLRDVVVPGGVVLSFGWDSNGMGRGRGFVIEELLLVCHGAGHHDTICLAERKSASTLFEADVDGLEKGE